MVVDMILELLLVQICLTGWKMTDSTLSFVSSSWGETNFTNIMTTSGLQVEMILLLSKCPFHGKSSSSRDIFYNYKSTIKNYLYVG